MVYMRDKACKIYSTTHKKFNPILSDNISNTILPLHYIALPFFSDDIFTSSLVDVPVLIDCNQIKRDKG